MAAGVALYTAAGALPDSESGKVKTAGPGEYWEFLGFGYRDALRRWQRDKNLTYFTWCRWFLLNLDTDRGLRIIDEYMQEYIRYAVTGRHYKGNYRIDYETLKNWGDRSLVHEFWEGRKG